jgi:methyl coenzyme M reductase subunit C
MEAGVRPIALGIGLAIVAAAGLLVVWGVGSGTPPSLPPGLTEVVDPAELAQVVERTRLEIFTSTNYLNQKIYSVRATLKNVSEKPIRLIDVKMTFVDYEKKVIKEEVRTAFDLKQRPLEPGTEYRAELTFENPPKNWNYFVPNTEVVKVAY